MNNFSIYHCPRTHIPSLDTIIFVLDKKSSVLTFLSYNRGKTLRFLEVFAEEIDNIEFTQAEEKVTNEIAATKREGLKLEKIVTPFEYIEFVRSLVYISDSDDIGQIKELIVISREDADCAKFKTQVIAAFAVLALRSNQYKSALAGFTTKLLALTFFDELEVKECQE